MSRIFGVWSGQNLAILNVLIVILNVLVLIQMYHDCTIDQFFFFNVLVLIQIYHQCTIDQFFFLRIRLQ